MPVDLCNFQSRRLIIFCKYFCKIFVRIFNVKSIFKKGIWWGDFPAIFGEVIATSSLARRDLLRHGYVMLTSPL